MGRNSLQEKRRRDYYSKSRHHHKNHPKVELVDDSLTYFGTSSNASNESVPESDPINKELTQESDPTSKESVPESYAISIELEPESDPISGFDINQCAMVDFFVTMDRTLVELEETKQSLHIHSPHFRAYAEIKVPPIPSGIEIQVGWVQNCSEYKFVNHYGENGMSSWEVADLILKNYSAMNDSDNTNYPFKGKDNESVHLKGPIMQESIVIIDIDDFFFEQVSWNDPRNIDAPPSLTCVYSKQTYNTGCMARVVNKDKIRTTLKNIEWTLEFAIKVNPERGLGKRATFIGPYQQQVVKMENDVDIDPFLPNLFLYKGFVWRDNSKSKPEVIKPPLEITMKNWMINNSFYASEIFKLNLKNFLLQMKEKKNRGLFEVRKLDVEM